MKRFTLIASLMSLFASSQATDFFNGSDVRIPGAGTGGTTTGSASIYPLTFSVSGIGTTTTDVNITLEFGTAPSSITGALGEEHSFAGDLDVMLVSPLGTTLVFLSDAGSLADLNGSYTFDDEAAEAVQESPTTQLSGGNLVNGSYRYSQYVGGDPFLSPAPSPNFGNILFSVFDGENPNGTWTIYIMDDAGGDVGWLMGSTLSIEAVPEPATITIVGIGLLSVLRARRKVAR